MNEKCETCFYCEMVKPTANVRHGVACCQDCHDYLEGKTPEGKAMKKLVGIGVRQLVKGKMYSPKR